MKKLFMIAAIILLTAAVLLSCTSCTKQSVEADNSVNETSALTDTAEDTGNGKKVYFAGPMFSYSEKDFNLELTKVLEDHGYQVFLPQRDGIEAALLEGMSEDEMVKKIFELDEKQVKNADIVFMNLDGRVPDEGACVELGIAHECGKRCYGFKTDTRSLEMGMDLNPLISGCMIKIFKNYDGSELIKEIDQYLSENEL